MSAAGASASTTERELARFTVTRLSIERTGADEVVVRWHGDLGLLAEQRLELPVGATLDIERPGELAVTAF